MQLDVLGNRMQIYWVFFFNFKEEAVKEEEEKKEDEEKTEEKKEEDKEEKVRALALRSWKCATIIDSVNHIC